jgi:hypothetical protein
VIESVGIVYAVVFVLIKKGLFLALAPKGSEKIISYTLGNLEFAYKIKENPLRCSSDPAPAGHTLVETPRFIDAILTSAREIQSLVFLCDTCNITVKLSVLGDAKKVLKATLKGDEMKMDIIGYFFHGGKGFAHKVRIANVFGRS